MKKSFSYTFIMVLFMTIIISSCKDYLELNPVSSFAPDYIFSDQSTATKAVLGAYSPLSGDDGYGKSLSMYFPYDDDEITCNGTGDNGGRKDIAHYSFQPSNPELSKPFDRLYLGIERANLCIYYIPGMDGYNNGTDAVKKVLHRLHGEALTLRAQYYFELIRNWGDVPAQYLPSSFETDLQKEKTNRDEIYDHLLADLALAADLVPWRSEVAKDTRITQGAVHALRARIALFRGGYSLKNDVMTRSDDYVNFYQIARDECNIIMQKGDHNLNTSFQAVFKDALDAHAIEPNGEVIWEVGMVNATAQTDSKLGYYNGPKDYALGTGGLIVLPTFFYSFDANDKRRDVTCDPFTLNIDNTITARPLELMSDGKFRRYWISNPSAPPTLNSNYLGVNWPLIRYSDVLLMFAEAENELNNGPTAAAIAAYEKVRLRAFGGDASKIGTTPLTHDAFFTAVMDERGWELCSEGVRKYDLIRWNQLATKLAETQDKLKKLAANQAPYDTRPTTMYYQNNVTPIVWLNDLYSPAPGVPPGPNSVKWVGSGTSSIVGYYAIGFQVNHSELFPFASSDLLSNPKLQPNVSGY